MQMLSQAARASRSDAVDVTTTATNDSELRLGESVTTPLWQHLACRTRRTQAGQHHQTAETAPESALLQKRPRDSHARVMTTHDSERRPNGRARSTTSPLHTRSRWCGRMALKPACPCVTLDHLRRAVVRSGKQAAAARLNSRCGRHNSILNDS